MAVQDELLNPIPSLSEAEYLRDVIEKLPGNIYWKNTQGQFLGCNAAVAKILSLAKPRDIIGKTNNELFDETLARAAEEIDQQVIQNRETIVTEETGLNEEGRQVSYLSTKVPLLGTNDEVIGILGSSIDISIRKEAEAKLRESHEKLQKLDKLKTEFIHNMQHDLRTPLTGLYAIMDFLRQEEGHTDERKELFSLGCSAAKELLGILDEFVNINKYDTGDFVLTEKEFNLKDTIENVIKLEALAMHQKKLQLRYHYDENVPEIIISDEHRIRGILINIISNAIKFTDMGFIEIEVKLHKKSDDLQYLFFRVKDSGNGIAKENQQAIFEKFKKLKPSNTGSYNGMGVGLYLVRRFLEELSGELFLKSEPGVGSEFSWWVPVKIKT
jgi:PAS domain S-box-containing protein